MVAHYFRRGISLKSCFEMASISGMGQTLDLILFGKLLRKYRLISPLIAANWSLRFYC
jgi:hypothetical protein